MSIPVVYVMYTLCTVQIIGYRSYFDVDTRAFIHTSFCLEINSYSELYTYSVI